MAQSNYGQHAYSSPLWGASKVEDTYNLLGHALKKAIGVMSSQQVRGLAEVAQDIGVDIVASSSLKGALDLNWDDPNQKNLASGIVLKCQKVNLVELHIDRAYLSSSLVQNRTDELTVYCKAWQIRNGKPLTKTAFVLDWDNHTICCPNQVTLPFSVGGKVQFPKNICATCPFRERCTTSRTGRSVSIPQSRSLCSGNYNNVNERPVGRAKLL